MVSFRIETSTATTAVATRARKLLRTLCEYVFVTGTIPCAVHST